MSTHSGRRDVLVIVELIESAASALTLELLGLARQIAREIGGGVGAVVIGNPPSLAEELIARGADRIYVFDTLRVDEYEGELWVAAAEKIARDVEPLAILCGHTTAGADLAPRLAFRLQSAAVTACIGISVESGTLRFTRPCFGGNVRETVSFTALPAIATIKPGVGSATADAALTGTTTYVSAPAYRSRTRLVSREREQGAVTRLENAKTIVAGGRGLEGPDGFRVLEELARVLEGAVGSSRVPCDLGWCPHSWQIGLTGKTVTPELYVAVGISGAGHHMAGCGNAKTIVAINTDPNAAIFKEARFGIVGDYRKVVPALVRAVSGLKANP
jgi:electron transfer flavoprotein alpha subunit